MTARSCVGASADEIARGGDRSCSPIAGRAAALGKAARAQVQKRYGWAARLAPLDASDRLRRQRSRDAA